MIPIRDMNRPSTTPHVNRLLLATNIIIFTFYYLSSQNILLNPRFAIDMMGSNTNAGRFVMIPAQILQGQRLYTLFTSMFMHATWLHLFGNMIYLYVFGDNVEDTFGHASYFIFYIVSGLAASFTDIISLTNPQDFTIGVVGASGAISGVLGAYVVLYPKSRILGFPIIVPIPAVIFLGFWFVLQWLSIVFNVASGVAYWAHIGGFIAGMILALTIGRKRKKAREARLHL